MTDVVVDARERSPGSGAVSAPRAAAAAARRHLPLITLLVVAAALRALAVVAIYPGIWFSDSNTYIAAAATGRLSLNRVMGYALVVAPFWRVGSAGALIIVQHAVGLALVVALYALLVRRGVARGLALAAVVPAALDGYLIEVEHTIMSETVFHAVVVGAIAALLWKERPSAATAAAGGLLLGYAAVVRSVALPFVAVFVVYLLVRRAGVRALLAFLVAWAIIPAGYATLFHAEHGKFGFTESDGRFLYARTAPFADCGQLGALPAAERALCPGPGPRHTTNWYRWGGTSPIAGLPASADPRIRDFARRVIVHQPLDYARVVVRGVLHYFEPGHRIGANDYPVAAWQFPSDPRHWGYPGYRGPIRPGNPRRHRRHPITEPNKYVGRMAAKPPRLDVAASRALHGYQRFVYSYGPLLAVCVLLVAVALVARRGAWRLRIDAALLAALVLCALVVSQAVSVFSYRYGLIAGLLLPPAAALAATALRASPPRPSPRAS